MQFIKNLGNLHKMFSVQAGGVAALMALQEVIPLWEGLLPDGAFSILSAVAATAAVLGRAVDQGLGS